MGVSNIGICISLAIFARLSFLSGTLFLSGTCVVVGPVGISMLGDPYCCVLSCCGVIAARVLCDIIVVADGIPVIGNSTLECKSIVDGGCKIGPILIQCNISVTDDIYVLSLC